MAVHRGTVRIASVALAATAAVLLAGCSSDNSSSDTTSPSTSAASTESPIGGDVLPPVIVDEGATSATAKVGDTIVFSVVDPENTTISTDNPTVLELTQGYSDGSATFNPGAKAIAAGTAVVTVEIPGTAPYEVSVTVE